MNDDANQKNGSLILWTDNRPCDEHLTAAVKAAGIFELYLPHKAQMRLLKNGSVEVTENYLTDSYYFVLRDSEENLFLQKKQKFNA